MAQLVAISTSEKTGVRKKNQNSTQLIKDFGLAGDAHGGAWHRQVSLLAQESIDFMREKGLDVVAGNFAENLTTSGINLPEIPVGTHLRIGECELIVSQLGKICHNRCAIYHQAGDCVMPREGIFGVVARGGRLNVGDSVLVLPQVSPTAALLVPATMENQHIEEFSRHLTEQLFPAFLRVERIQKATTGKKSNLRAVLEDLVMQQQITRIVTYDPDDEIDTLSAGINLMGSQSRLHHCRTLEELTEL